MPNPFPGMDPYLEGDLWTSVHLDLAAEFVRQLSPRLHPKYVALSSRRVVLATPDDVAASPQRLPDVGIVSSGRPGELTGSAATAVPLVANAVLPVAIPQRTVEIRDTSDRRLVTAIELLSPTNKRGRGHGRYARKRLQVLSGSAHLVEIDLIRVGQRFPVDRVLPSVPYFVFLSRAERRPRVEYWPVPLAQPLPVTPIPLLPGDPDVSLDLQAALDAIHATVGYEFTIDYAAAPPGSLSPEDAAWVEERLRQAGRRP